MPESYWSDETCSLYLGDCREVLPALGVTADLVVADPPYGETSLAWDRWPRAWPSTVFPFATSMWCFGSMRMFLEQRDEFTSWRLSQDVVWEKQNGSGMAVDRFRRVHEHALHWYHGPWSEVRHETPIVPATAEQIARNGRAARKTQPAHQGKYSPAREWVDTGTRLMRSVIKAQNLRGLAIHPTEKPVEILTPLIAYGCPEGSLVIDPFAGSGSTLEAARLSGRRAIGIEADERYLELAARRLSHTPLEFAQ